MQRPEQWYTRKSQKACWDCEPRTLKLHTGTRDRRLSRGLVKVDLKQRLAESRTEAANAKPTRNFHGCPLQTLKEFKKLTLETSKA